MNEEYYVEVNVEYERVTIRGGMSVMEGRYDCGGGVSVVSDYERGERV